jgi:hypothetical protein
MQRREKLISVCVYSRRESSNWHALNVSGSTHLICNLFNFMELGMISFNKCGLKKFSE